ncbi:uncharacterized protein LOC132732193 isoform X2 [Ruditapes philippinarum]|uniref:uncharacterized protein LOC132732193 isoform X2 n=1 Tax=Ruditapes philippinarum TaxID=129788 RepID=UPI00295ADE5F|nr:uncharacterized protein LOC132732193 isoform X2 [Ruditapes philippinarum]
MLLCNVTGILQAPVDVDWFFKGERIITSLAHWKDRTQILRRTRGKMYISELIVERSTLHDKGIYVCRSSGSSIEVDSITVNVLSDSVNLPESYKSAADAIHHSSSMIHILTITVCVITVFTSSNSSNLPTRKVSIYQATVFNCDNYAHR